MTDEESIRRSLGLLCQLRDDGRYDEWIQLFADDGTFAYGGPTYRGRREVKEHCETTFPPYGKHLCLNSVIDVDTETGAAVASSDFVKMHPAEDPQPGGARFFVAATGRYQDRFVRRDGRWLLAERVVVVMA
jgi:hypothetical protein